MQNLVATLAQQFGLKPEQVQLAVGAILQLLQERGGGADLQSLIAKVPGAAGFLAQAQSAPAASGGGGLLGQAAGLLGALGGGQAGGGLAGLAGVMGKLESAGLKPDTAMQFVPALLEQFKAAAGPETVSRLIEKVPGLQGGGGAAGALGALFK